MGRSWKRPARRFTSGICILIARVRARWWARIRSAGAICRVPILRRADPTICCFSCRARASLRKSEATKQRRNKVRKRRFWFLVDTYLGRCFVRLISSRVFHQQKNRIARDQQQQSQRRIVAVRDDAPNQKQNRADQSQRGRVWISPSAIGAGQ